MAAKKLDESFLREVAAVHARNGRSRKATAAHFGESQGTVAYWIERAAALKQPEPAFDLPVFPDSDLKAPEILDQMERRFGQRLEHANALRWFEIKIRDDKPVGLMPFGDPHMGSNGCNVALLRRDVQIAAKTPGVMAVNIGDTADNWPWSGKLVRLYAENDVSKQTERTLARWFLKEAGIPWVVWLHGNHDVMDPGFATYLAGINCAQVPMVDWRARFRLVFPNRREVKVDAAHNHKGHSMWNELHGQERASVMDEFAHIYVAGHHHTAAVKQKEIATGDVVTLLRVRGYKWIDSHAENSGFHRKTIGASAMLVIEPKASSPTGLVTPFLDAEEGAEYLKYRRKKAA
jgi:hypothetical protein